MRTSARLIRCIGYLPRPLVVGDAVKVAMGPLPILRACLKHSLVKIVLSCSSNCWAARCGQASRSEDWRHKIWHFRLSGSVAAGAGHVGMGRLHPSCGSNGNLAYG